MLLRRLARNIDISKHTQTKPKHRSASYVCHIKSVLIWTAQQQQQQQHSRQHISQMKWAHSYVPFAHRLR